MYKPYQDSINFNCIKKFKKINKSNETLKFVKDKPIIDQLHFVLNG